MSPHLHLVKATNEKRQYAKSADVVYLQAAPYGQLKLGRMMPTTVNTRPNYFAYLLVAISHFLLLAWMMEVSTQDHLVPKAPAPMMVSLVDNPVPIPEEAIVDPTLPVPIQPKKVVQPKKPVIKQVEKPQPIVQETALAESTPVVTEAPPTALSQVAKTTSENTTTPVVSEAPPVVEPPKFGAAYLHNPAPTYPPLSRRLGEEGRALLRVLVAENGIAQTVDLEASSGSSRLDQAAIAAVKRWEFVPAKRDRQNISAYVLVPIKFSLTN
jgi:periplasmic protein TonB